MAAKIKPLGNNKYQFSVSAGYKPNGKQRNFYKTATCESYAEAQKTYKIFAADCVQGKIIAPETGKMTLSQFYTYWLDNYASQNLAVSTRETTEHTSSRILAALGHLRIDKIKLIHCAEFFTQLSSPTASTNNTPLSSATIHKHYELLNSLLNKATEWELIVINPLSKTKTKPRREKKRIKLPTREETSHFLKLMITEVDKYRETKQKKKYKTALKWLMCTLLAFMLGYRTEEIFGLQKTDINNNIISINRAAVYVKGKGIIVGAPKSDSGYRQSYLAPFLLNYLNEYLTLIAKDKVISSNGWLFSKDNGEIAHTQAFGQYLRRFCDDNKIPRINPHLLRHMNGSHLLKGGTDLATVSKSLGLSKKSFTADTYIHVLEEIDTQIPVKMQKIVENLIL